MEEPQKPKPWQAAAGYIAAVGTSCLIWILSSYLINKLSPIHDRADLASVLFGAASIALFVFSILIALLAVIGWKTAQEIINERVEAITQAKLKTLVAELRGRVLVIEGHVIGEMSIHPDTLEPQDDYNKARLYDALRLTQQGYEYLKTVHEPAEFMALNNLVAYSCAAQAKHQSGFIIEQAKKLLEKGEQKNSTDLILTACRAILQFHAGADLEKRAKETLESLINNPNPSVTDKQKKEARSYFNKFCVPQAAFRK